MAPAPDQRGPARCVRDEQIAAEPPLPPLDLPADAIPAPVEAHLARLVDRTINDMDPLLSRITTDPAICHGKPCVRGLRYPVENLLELLTSSMTIDEILADHEDLERDDLLAALVFADSRNEGQTPTFGSNYTAERDTLFGDITLEQIINGMRARRIGAD